MTIDEREILWRILRIGTEASFGVHRVDRPRLIYGISRIIDRPKREPMLIGMAIINANCAIASRLRWGAVDRWMGWYGDGFIGHGKDIYAETDVAFTTACRRLIDRTRFDEVVAPVARYVGEKKTSRGISRH